MTKTLPRKASDTIRLAIKDLNKVERDKKHYQVQMGVWHDPNGTCAVCFAGAVMAKTLDANPSQYLDPDDFSSNTEPKLRALDYFRVGEIKNGIDIFYNPTPNTWMRLLRRFDKAGLPTLIKVPAYRPRNPKPFKDAMRKLATRLARAGF